MSSINHDLIIRTTNRLAIYATIGLIYWVVTFLTIRVFDLKIFREQLTDMFFLSLLGIFAILGGAVILNVMSNLSKISQSVATTEFGDVTPQRKKIFRLLLVVPILISILFVGDWFSAQEKKQQLIRTAENFIQENQSALLSLSQYKFSPEYVKNAEKTFAVLNKIDKNFPEVMIVFPDLVEGKELFIGFGEKRYSYDEKEALEKTNYIYSTSIDEREYLKKVFAGSDMSYRLHVEKGKYQLYFPATIGGNKIVIYLSDYQRYGKYGS